MQRNCTVLCSTVRYSALQYISVQYIIGWHSTNLAECSTVQLSRIRHNTNTAQVLYKHNTSALQLHYSTSAVPEWN